MKVSLKEVEYWQIRHFKAAAARERSILSDTHDTKWFAAMDEEGGIVGVSGIMGCSSGKARGKGSYTLPEARGRGIYRIMLQRLVDAAKETNCSCIEAFFTPAAWSVAQKLGFKKLLDRPGGITHGRMIL